MIKGIIIAALFIILAVIFLMGKGDMLIAGYNTASEEKRQQVNIHRLRWPMAIVCILTAGFCGALPFIGNNKSDFLSFTFLFILTLLVIIILANTWAKKK